MRAKVVFLAMVASAGIGAAARAGHVSAALTRENGMNAVRLGGETQTLLELIDRRSRAPRRFDLHHPRLGTALSLGIDGLLERQALNQRRFDRWHPIIAYLLDDYRPDGDLGGFAPPLERTPLVLPSQPTPLASSIGPTPSAVPEPGSLVLLGTALATLALVRLRAARANRSAKV